ncbi:DUF2971 domain-containing protein [Paenibacillus sp. Marseille-Q9583]
MGVLYKFRDINEFTMKIFSENSFWYSKVKDLNDPNEGYRKQISKLLADSFINRHKQNQLSGFLFSPSPNPEAEKFRKKVLDVFEKKEYWDIDRKHRYLNCQLKQHIGRQFSKPAEFIESIDKVINNAGVLSLSSDPLNDLLWAHYAAQHKGIAIGVSNYSAEAYKPVTYIPRSMPISMDLKHYNATLKMYDTHNSLEITFDDPSIQKVLTTKIDTWDYESEWRGLKEAFGSHPIEGEITEIIFGLRCELSTREEIMRSVKLSDRLKNVQFKEIYQSDLNLKLRNL